MGRIYYKELPLFHLYDSVSNLSAKLQRESIRYKEVVELADVLDCDIVWVKRGERR